MKRQENGQKVYRSKLYLNTSLIWRTDIKIQEAPRTPITFKKN